MSLERYPALHRYLRDLLGADDLEDLEPVLRTLEKDATRESQRTPNYVEQVIDG